MFAAGASAAGLAVSARSLGAATVATPRCTTSSLAVLPTLAGSAVASVTISGVPAACGGAMVRVTVNNGSAAGSGSMTVPAGGGTIVVPVTGSPTVDANVQIDLAMEGP
jgi:hypothetical protein